MDKLEEQVVEAFPSPPHGEDQKGEEAYHRGKYTLQFEQGLKAQLLGITTRIKAQRQAIDNMNANVTLSKAKLKEIQQVVLTFYPAEEKQLNQHMSSSLGTTSSSEYEAEVALGHAIHDLFTREEGGNFALYRYIQSVNHEIEPLEDQTCACNAEREVYTKELREGSVFTRKRLMETLEELKKKFTAMKRSGLNSCMSFNPLPGRWINYSWPWVVVNSVRVQRKANNNNNNNRCNSRVPRRPCRLEKTPRRILRMPRIYSWPRIRLQKATFWNVLPYVIVSLSMISWIVEKYLKNIWICEISEYSSNRISR